METLTVNLKNKKDVKLMKELAARLNASIEKPESKKNDLPKSKFKSEDELRAIGGIAKGQLISKEHLRIGVSEKSTDESKKYLPKGKFKSEEDFMRFAGSMKGVLISKDNLRDLSWKKRNW